MDQTPRTPENAPKIPKDDSFKTCKASPAIRRRLRATPARLSILSGAKPYKEGNSSHKKFNSRRKANHHDDTAGSNETFIRHEQELIYDRDSLDPSHQIPQHFIDNVTKQVIAPRTSSPKFRTIDSDRELSPIQSAAKKSSSSSASARRMSSPRKVASPKKVVSPKKSGSSQKKFSPTKQNPTRVVSRPMPKPRLMAAPKPKPMPKPTPVQWNRYMSSTAKKPMVAPSSQFKKPTLMTMNSSVASSRRFLGQLNTPRMTRTQSFKSTAELEREYFASLRSSKTSS